MGSSVHIFRNHERVPEQSVHFRQPQILHPMRARSADGSQRLSLPLRTVDMAEQLLLPHLLSAVLLRSQLHLCSSGRHPVWRRLESGRVHRGWHQENLPVQTHGRQDRVHARGDGVRNEGGEKEEVVQLPLVFHVIGRLSGPEISEASGGVHEQQEEVMC